MSRFGRDGRDRSRRPHHFRRTFLVRSAAALFARGSGPRKESLLMPSTTTAGAKICCKCGVDVAGKKRVKDRQGNYWCADCSRADEKRKRLVEGGICAGCGEHFFGPGLTLIGDNTYCKKCLRTRARQETSGFVNN